MHHGLGLLLTTAMNHRIVGVPSKGAMRIGTLHPAIKRIMHEQVHQNRTDHAPLRSTALSRYSDTFIRLEWRREPPLDIKQNPVFLDVSAYRFHQENMIDLIEGRYYTLPISSTFPRELKQSAVGISLR